jgi:hypothetical protein
MSAPPILRHEDGRFLPGLSPNPSGRPKGAGAIRELAREYLPAALKKIGELIENPDPRVALAASQEIVNRVFGRPVQAIDSEVKKFDMNALYLAAVKLAGDPALQIVDVTPAELSDDTPEPTEDHPATTAVTDW